MAPAYSEGLRRRVIAAVEARTCCRRAATRYESGEITAIRRVARWRRTGVIGARPQGGDRRLHRIEAQAGLILATVEGPGDIALAERVGHVRTETGARFAVGTFWRFFRRRGVTVKRRGHAAEQERADMRPPARRRSRPRPPSIPSG